MVPKIFVGLLVACFSFVVVQASRAAPAEAADFLTLRQAIERVLSANPEVAAVHYRTEAARARIPQAKALEDPMVGVMFDDTPIRTANIRRAEEIDYRMEQKIPFPGKRHVRGKEARFEAEAASEVAGAKTHDVLLDLKKTYYEIYRLERSLEVNRRLQGIFRGLRGSAETAYATGQTGGGPPLQAQVELSKLGNEAVLLEQEHKTHVAHLRALLNTERHEEIRLPHSLSWPHLKDSLEAVEAKALEFRPELRELSALAKRDRAHVTVSRQGLLPDFSLGFQYGQRPNAQDTWTAQAMINLPVFFLGKNRAAMKEANASLKATEAEREAMTLHTHHEIEQAYSAVQAMEQVVGTYQKGLLPQARTNLEVARSSYATQKEDFLIVVDAARTLRDLEMSYYESQAGLGMAFAELERLVGRELQ